jgi:shikimate 5-dehydrogenase
VAAIEGTTRLIGLIGDPVSGSLSPRMQNAALAARGLDWAYVAMRVDLATLDSAVAGLAALGFAGVNVTTPHKTGVIPLCEGLDESAERAGSVNTLVFEHGRILGASTDAEARGIPAHAFSRRETWPPETAGADLVVHATPVKDELLFEPVAGQTLIDLAYKADGSDTAHVAAARAAGAKVVDGLEVLVRQGAASFERWTGVPAPLDVMRAAIRP